MPVKDNNDVSSVSMSHEAGLYEEEEDDDDDDKVVVEHSSGDYKEEEEEDDVDDDEEEESESEPMPNEISVPSPEPSFGGEDSKNMKKKEVDENYTLLLDTLRSRRRDEVTGFSQGRAIKSACEKQQRKSTSYSFAGITSLVGSYMMRSTSVEAEHKEEREEEDELDLNEMNRRLHQKKMAADSLLPPRDETILVEPERRKSCFSATTLDILGVSERSSTDVIQQPNCSTIFEDDNNSIEDDGDNPAVDPPAQNENENENPINNNNNNNSRSQDDDETHNDEEYQYWLSRVQKNGLDLQHAPKKYRGNRTIVLTAIEECGWALEHAVPNLRNDRGIVLKAVSKSGGTKKYASLNLQNDPEILNAVANSHHHRNSSCDGSSKNSRTSSKEYTEMLTQQINTPKAMKV